MPSYPSLLLITAFTVWPSFVFAQRTTDATAGPIARSIAREVGRLGTAQQPDAPAESGGRQRAHSDWSRVRRLKPGTQLVLIVNSAPQVVRSLVSSDEATLTVLNPAESLAPITIARTEIAEVRTLPSKHVGRYAWRGALIGAAIGAAVGGVAAGTDNSLCCGDQGMLVGAGAGAGGIYGVLIGVVVGAVVPRRSDVIYRTPGRARE